METKRGQSLIELIIAMSIFAAVISVTTFFFLNSYLSDRTGGEITKASFLAIEGMEAVRAIRDNNWADLSLGQHGLILFGNQWLFQGTEEDVSSMLNGGIRKITVEEAGSNRKKVTSEVTWLLTEDRPQEVRMITYLTNWSDFFVIESCSDYCISEGYVNGTCRANQNQCSRNGEYYEPEGDQFCIGGPSQDTCCCAQ